MDMEKERTRHKEENKTDRDIHYTNTATIKRHKLNSATAAFRD